MNETICPHCGKAFKVDEAAYANILKQVRDKEFNAQLNQRLQLAEQAKQDAVELALAKLRTELKLETQQKETMIKELRAQLEAGKSERALAVNHADRSQKRDALRSELQQAERDRQHTIGASKNDLASAVELTQQKVSSQLRMDIQQQQVTIPRIESADNCGALHRHWRFRKRCRASIKKRVPWKIGCSRFKQQASDLRNWSN